MHIGQSLGKSSESRKKIRVENLLRIFHFAVDFVPHTTKKALESHCVSSKSSAMISPKFHISSSSNDKEQKKSHFSFWQFNLLNYLDHRSETAKSHSVWEVSKENLTKAKMLKMFHIKFYNSIKCSNNVRWREFSNFNDRIVDRKAWFTFHR